MPDILHRLPIRAPMARVFEAFAAPQGLNEWWTLDASGVAEQGEAYHLDFGPEYRWKALVAAVDHANDHFRTSSCCWAQYLRILRRFLEHGERVPYAERLDV